MELNISLVDGNTGGLNYIIWRIFFFDGSCFRTRRLLLYFFVCLGTCVRPWTVVFSFIIIDYTFEIMFSIFLHHILSVK